VHSWDVTSQLGVAWLMCNGYGILTYFWCFCLKVCILVRFRMLPPLHTLFRRYSHG